MLQDKYIGYVTGSFDNNFVKNFNLRLAFSHLNASAVNTTYSHGATITSSKTFGYVGYTFGKDVDTNARNKEYRIEYQFFI